MIIVSDEDHQYRLDLYNQGLTDEQIARKCYLTREAISFWRKRHNLPAHHRTNDRLSEEVLKKTYDLYLAGRTRAEIASAVGITPREVYYRIQRYEMLLGARV